MRNWIIIIIIISSSSSSIKYIKYVFYSLKVNSSFILYLKLHKILATSFAVLPSSGPSEKLRMN